MTINSLPTAVEILGGSQGFHAGAAAEALAPLLAQAEKLSRDLDWVASQVEGLVLPGSSRTQTKIRETILEALANYQATRAA